jgi:hypothetical protein
MVSYIKTQWISLLVGLANIGFFVYDFANGNELASILWLISALTWLIMSVVEYHNDCIEKLNERLEALERENKK